jgi:hypothetical protein
LTEGEIWYILNVYLIVSPARKRRGRRKQRTAVVARKKAERRKQFSK